MSSSSDSALPDLISCSPLQAQTSAQLLRLRESSNGTLVLDVSEHLGNDITAHVGGERVEDNVGSLSLAASDNQAPQTTPFLQIVYLCLLHCICKLLINQSTDS